MKKLYLILFSVFDLIFQIFCFNIDVDNPIIYLDQTNYLKVNLSKKSSYFGLSVILYPGDNIHNPWVQIAAPRGNSPNIPYQNPGILFRCGIRGPCDYLEVDKEFGNIEHKNGIYFNKLDDAWIGAAMDINLSSNRSVVCAPRWIRVFRAGLPNSDYRMLGACYWSHLNTKQFFKKLPLFDEFNDIYSDSETGDAVYNYAQGESGFSVHLPRAENELLIGAPGVFNWKGTVIQYKDRISHAADPIANRYSVSRTPKRERQLSDIEIFYDDNVANSRTTTQTLAFGLFGYAVTSGYFYSPMRLYYAGGAPRSKNYFGQVLIYDFRKNRDRLLDVKDSKQGQQYGEYFGACVAAGDINNDGLDDLFVGAPFHRNTKFNEGRMYLFLGNKKGTLQEPLRVKFIDGNQANGQFGTSITYLGEMTSDRYTSPKAKYVAVSAPYEEVSGVVYIYRGNEFGLDPTPVQKIIGKSITPDLKGFGISISKPADIDGNGYEDIAVGSYKSGHVVLLRSKPLVTVNTYFQYTPDTISSEIKEFQVTICHRYYCFGGMDTVQITRRIVVDEDFNRAFSNSRTRNITIQRGKPSCENINITMRESGLDIYQPLTVKVTHHLLEERSIPEQIIISNKVAENDPFCIRCGVYDDFRSKTTATTTIPFALGCGNDNKCVSELEFDTRFNGTGVSNNTFILGATNVVELETIVKNKGEKAYSLEVQVDLPKGLSFKNTPTLCQQNQTIIVCPIANPLNRGDTGSLSLKLDMDLINKRIVEDFVLINVTILTTSENKNQAFKIIRLNLTTQADISISGKSGEQSYSYGIESNKSVEFQQIYQIGKYGLSPVSVIRFEILIPYALKKGSGVTTFISLYQPEGYLEGGQSLIFDSDIPFLVENKFGATEGVVHEKSAEIRNKRDVDRTKAEVELFREVNFLSKVGHFKQEPLDSDLLGNKTFEINCNMAEIICGRVFGKTGPFDGLQKSAVMQLRMLFDAKSLSGLLKKNSIIQYSTYGQVEIEDPPNLIQSDKRPDMVMVSSLFVNDAEKKPIDTWIIIVSIVSGLLLLLILTLGLTKAGFFKRKKLEELKQLKAQAGIENTGGTIKETDAENSSDLKQN